MTQKFCVACGADLTAALRARHETHDKWLADAVAAAKQYDFESAMSLLQRLIELSDHRFRVAAGNGKKAFEKVSALKEQAESGANAAIEAAAAAYEAEEYAEVVKILGSVPAILMDEESRKRLARSKAFYDEVTTLEGEMKVAIEKRDWSLAGGLVGQLIEAAPDRKDYQSMGRKISRKLLAESEKLFQAQRYQRAVDKLGAIPPSCVGDADAQLRDRITNAEWLSAQFDVEPFATPMLGRLAVRFAKEFPEDKDAQDLVKKLSQTLKQSPRPPRLHLPPWKADRVSWAGGKAGWLAFPKAIDMTDQTPMRAAAGKFNVAIGIAMQALGQGRTLDFFPPKKKKGLLGGFGRKKKPGLWAFDIGSASLKAVRAELRDDKVVITDSYYTEFEVPFCRLGHGEDMVGVLTPIIEKMKAEKDVEDVPIYANVASSKTVTRFVRLPPVSDKQAADLIQLEIENRIPIPMDELASVQHICPLYEETEHGRAAVVTAAKRRELDERYELLSLIGLEASGLQADSVALANFASVEFADLWAAVERPDEDDVEGAESEPANKKKKKPKRKKNEAPFDNSDEKTASVLLIDCGASSIKMVVTSGETYWAWTVETGGEDLTSILARSTKTTHLEAETLKKNPAAIASPALMYQPIELRLDEVRVRLERILADAKQQNSRFEIKEVWCMGGGSFAHQWLRRLAMAGGS